MTRSITVSLLLASLLVVLPAAHGNQPKGNHAGAKAKSYTGYYVNHYQNVSDSLKVLELPGGKIKFELLALLMGSDSPRNGEVHGIVRLSKEGVANFDDGCGCKVRLRFSKNKVNVHVDGEDACGFGAFVTAEGDYKKKDSQTPKFDWH